MTKYHQRLRAALGVENAVPPTMIASAGTVSTIFTVSISSFLIFMEKIVFLINTSSLQRVFLLYCQAFRVQNFFADPQCQNADADPDIGSDYRRWVVPFSFLCRIHIWDARRQKVWSISIINSGSTSSLNIILYHFKMTFKYNKMWVVLSSSREKKKTKSFPPSGLHSSSVVFFIFSSFLLQGYFHWNILYQKFDFCSTATSTVSGRICQKWSLDFPHSHS